MLIHVARHADRVEVLPGAAHIVITIDVQSDSHRLMAYIPHRRDAAYVPLPRGRLLVEVERLIDELRAQLSAEGS